MYILFMASYRHSLENGPTTDEREEWITHIPRFTALLNPGDILINAGWWWHDVQSIGASCILLLLLILINKLTTHYPQAILTLPLCLLPEELKT